MAVLIFLGVFSTMNGNHFLLFLDNQLRIQCPDCIEMVNENSNKPQNVNEKNESSTWTFATSLPCTSKGLEHNLIVLPMHYNFAKHFMHVNFRI